MAKGGDLWESSLSVFFKWLLIRFFKCLSKMSLHDGNGKTPTTKCELGSEVTVFGT